MGQDQVSGGVSVLCWLAAPVAMFYGNLQNSITRSKSVLKSSSVISSQICAMSDQPRVPPHMAMPQNVMQHPGEGDPTMPDEIPISTIKLPERKRKRSDSVLWQKPLHQQQCQKGKVTTQTTPQKSSITQRLRTDFGRSVGVTTATQLVWLTGLRAHLPTNRNNRLIKRTHV